MGRGVEDVQEELKLFPFRLADDLQPGEVLRIQLGNRSFTPPEISAFILRQLKRNAERFFGAPVTKAVITVPAYFNDAQRQATKDAGRIAGLDVLRLVNEPTAASLAYGLDKKTNGTIAVYDLGGGTFDISILKLHDGIFEVIATNGDTHLGGDDIDNLLITIALDDIRGDMGIDLRRNGEAVQAIRKAVIDAKIALSSQDLVKLDLELPGGKHYRREITREHVRATHRSRSSTARSGPCKQALKDAGAQAGADRRSSSRRRFDSHSESSPARAGIFKRVPHTDLNPDEVVALGAAVQANILAGGSEATKEHAAARCHSALARHRSRRRRDRQDHPCATRRSLRLPPQHFTTQVDGQTNVAIHVLQGERELAKDCRSLARFDLKGIPPMPAGMPRIEVKFLIDANGILHVSAREQRSGKEAEIEVQPSYGLTDEQVESMMLDRLITRKKISASAR